jgi:cytochrome c-type biogenesis protein CcmH/NrfG
VSLAPASPEAWLVLARLAAQSGDARTAESALQRVEALVGGEHPLVAETRALVATLRQRTN